MGTHSTGYLTQNFTIRIDVGKLREYIEEKIIEAIESEKTKGKPVFTDVEIDESYFEDDELVITGSYDTAYEYWHFDATLESPEENETEYEGIAGWGDGSFLYALPDSLKGLITVSCVDADKEGVNFHVYDPDDYYDD